MASLAVNGWGGCWIKDVHGREDKLCQYLKTGLEAWLKPCSLPVQRVEHVLPKRAKQLVEDVKQVEQHVELDDRLHIAAPPGQTHVHTHTHTHIRVRLY